MRVRPVKPVFMAAGGVAGVDYLRGVLFMSDLRKAAQMALEALESGPDVDPIFAGETIDALRAALAQPEPTRSQQIRDAGYTRRPRQLPKEDEPVAYMQTENFIDPDGLWDERKTFNCEGDGAPLYTAPPQRKPLRTVIYACPICAASLERQE